MAEWLEENGIALGEDRERGIKFDAAYVRMAELGGYPQDTIACRRFMLRLAESRGYPAVGSLGIFGSAAGWSAFLASDCGIDALREAAAALRRR